MTFACCTRLRLVLTGILLYLVVPSFQCDINCVRLSKVPPRWNYQEKEVPNFALMCSVKSQCQLNINELIGNYTETLAYSVYISLDVHFTCTTEELLGKYI